jgi:hypothetical protein
MSEQEAKQRSRKRTPNNRTTTGFCISALVVGHFTTEAFGACEHPSQMAGGRPRVDDRDCADAIFYVLRAGWKSASFGSDRVVCAHERPMIAFKNGYKQESSGTALANRPQSHRSGQERGQA